MYVHYIHHIHCKIQWENSMTWKMILHIKQTTNWFGTDKWKGTKKSLREFQAIVAANTQKTGQWYHLRSYEKWSNGHHTNSDITQAPPESNAEILVYHDIPPEWRVHPAVT